jgi:hypothetical protein
LWQTDPNGRCKLDLHVDMIIGGVNCILLETSGETAVLWYTPSLMRMMNCYWMFPLVLLWRHWWISKGEKLQTPVCKHFLLCHCQLPGTSRKTSIWCVLVAKWTFWNNMTYNNKYIHKWLLSVSCFFFIKRFCL